MRLEFGADDGKAFEKARDVLIGRFEAWLSASGGGQVADPQEAASDAWVVLDWKWGYGDGDLGRWDTADVADFLLEWCPRKLSASAEDVESLPSSVAALTAFLDAEGLLAAGSSSVADLGQAAADLAPDFREAMSDPSKFGMGKSLSAAAAASGFDLSDPDDVQKWMDEFNSRPDEERRRIIPETALGHGAPRPPRMPQLPPVVLPDDEAVAASKAEAPIVGLFAAFAAYVGEGRKLTQKTGNLTLADARALTDLLETGDRIDREIGGRTFKTRSSADLPRLRQLFIWARKAGIVKVVHGKVIATKRGLAVGSDPGGCFDHAADALLAIGPVTSRRLPDMWLATPQIDELIDQECIDLLAGAYIAGGPLPIQEMVDVAIEMVGYQYDIEDKLDRITRSVGWGVADMLEGAQLAGIARLTLDETGPDDRFEQTMDGSVTLTPAGVVFVRDRLLAKGYGVPVAGEHASGTATQLFLATDAGRILLQPDHPDVVTVAAEMEAWIARRTPAAAAAGLADAVREIPDPGTRTLALGVLGSLEDTGAVEVAVRDLDEDPDTRGYARSWLVAGGLAAADTLYEPDGIDWFVDVLCHRLITGDTDSLLDALALVGPHDEQIAAIDRMWRSPSAATELVLSAIGDSHPGKPVAKAAKKAAFKRRSWTPPASSRR